jgi:hypothetical protein
MATRTWTDGGADGDWSNTANWSGGAVPVDGDDVVIGDTTRAITAGLNQAGVDLASLKITGGASIGSSSTPLTIGVSGTLTWSGTGSYIKIKADTTDGITRAVIQPTGGGTAYLSGGTFDQVEGGSGLVDIDATAVVTTALGAGAGWSIAYNATGITTFTLAKGTATTKRSIGTADVGPGALLVTQLTAGISTKVTVQPGGYFNHQASGTIAHSEVRPDGKANAAHTPYSGFTVTNRTNFRGFKENFNLESVSVTFDNAATTVAALTPSGSA